VEAPPRASITHRFAGRRGRDRHGRAGGGGGAARLAPRARPESDAPRRAVARRRNRRSRDGRRDARGLQLRNGERDGRPDPETAGLVDLRAGQCRRADGPPPPRTSPAGCRQSHSTVCGSRAVSPSPCHSSSTAVASSRSSAASRPITAWRSRATGDGSSNRQGFADARSAARYRHQHAQVVVHEVERHVARADASRLVGDHRRDVRRRAQVRATQQSVKQRKDGVVAGRVGQRIGMASAGTPWGLPAWA
jgi:hypothetical protein